MARRVIPDIDLSSSRYRPLQRSLSLLRCLQRTPATLDELADLVAVDADAAVYRGLTPDARRKRLENDIQRLRELGVEIEYREGQYHLNSYGDFHPVNLDEIALEALAFLAETFGPGAPNHDSIHHLIRTVANWLPESKRDSIPLRRLRLRVDLRRRDADDIAPAVQARVERAVSERRLLRFAYRSPGQSDATVRLHTVQPWQLYFDVMRGHLYLDAYRTEVRGPHGVWRQGQWQQYRLGRIQAEGIELLPDRLPPFPPKRPRFRLEYAVGPEIARWGEITRHFDDMQVDPPDTTGWVRVRATTPDLFRAVRLLLSYGPNCRVIGGPEARQEMIRLVQSTAKLYEEEG